MSAPATLSANGYAVTCPEKSTDGLASAILAQADTVSATPILPGCSTPEVVAAVQKAALPIPLPDAFPADALPESPGGRGTTLLLARASNPQQAAFIGDQAGGRVFLFLNSDDFWRDYETYKARGVTFVREPKEADYGMVAVFQDLYGNRWDLLQLRPDHPVAKRCM